MGEQTQDGRIAALDALHSGIFTARCSCVSDSLDDLAHELHGRRCDAASKPENDESTCVLRLLGRDRDEIAHSRIVAWLLSEECEHGLRDRFLVELLRDGQILDGFPGGPYRVTQEVWGGTSRIDIVVQGDRFVLGIENKLDGDLQPHQLERELADVEMLAAGRWYRMIYLALWDAPDRPVGVDFVSYQSVLTALHECLDEVVPSARAIIDDFGRHVCTHLLGGRGLWDAVLPR
jgi:hypothetical protein